jgi:hypothetical protein
MTRLVSNISVRTLIERSHREPCGRDSYIRLPRWHPAPREDRGCALSRLCWKLPSPTEPIGRSRASSPRSRRARASGLADHNCPRRCEKNFRWRRPRHTLKGRRSAGEIVRVGLRLQLRKAEAHERDQTVQRLHCSPGATRPISTAPTRTSNQAPRVRRGQRVNPRQQVHPQGPRSAQGLAYRRAASEIRARVQRHRGCLARSQGAPIWPTKPSPTTTISIAPSTQPYRP